MILIIPDIHGRKFWKEAVKTKCDHIIFLGDYLDPYTFEEGITHEDALNNFIEIIEFKKNNPDLVTLLIGNHDCTYMYNHNICNCRANRRDYVKIHTLFRENKDLFLMAYEHAIDGKIFVFSHAGIHKDYIDYVFGENNVNSDNLVRAVNEAYRNAEVNFIESLGFVSHWRGGFSSYGSIVWSDIREWLSSKDYDDVYQIVGHTRSQSPIVLENIAMLDSIDKAYLLDNFGNITTLEGDKLNVISFKSHNDENE